MKKTGKTPLHPHGPVLKVCVCSVFCIITHPSPPTEMRFLQSTENFKPVTTSVNTIKFRFNEWRRVNNHKPYQKHL